MDDHDTIRALVAELDLPRLTSDQRRSVEEHLARCPSCAALAASVRTLREHVRRGGEAMFEPHSEPADLREFAAGKGGRAARVGRHIELCSTCRLEVEAWTKGRSAGRAVPRQERADGSWKRLGLATVAAAIIGVAAGWRFHASFAPGRAEPSRIAAPDADQPVSTTGAPGITEAPAAGAPVLHLLPGLVRGETAVQRWTLDRGESSVSVAVPITVPATVADADRFRFEFRGPGAETVWSQEMAVARIREHLEAADVVNLVVIPPQVLQPGEYEFRVVPSAPAPAGGAPIYRARITIGYCQSPAATKAPQ